MKTFFLVAVILLTVSCKEWEIKNTGIPLAQRLGVDKLWIVSDQSFSCLDKNSSILWRVSAGEEIIQSVIDDSKGIVYLSRENGVSKLGLRSLGNGNLKWEVHVGNVLKFSCQDYIHLDDSTALTFNGEYTDVKIKVEKEDQKNTMEFTKNVLKIGSYTFNYNTVEFGDPKSYDIADGDLLVNSESGLTLFYKDLELIWTRDESLTQVITSTFVKVGAENKLVVVTKLGTIVALDALTGSKMWRIFLKNKSFSYIGVSDSDGKESLNVCSLQECIEIDAENGQYEYILREADLKFVSSVAPKNGDLDEIRGLVVVDSKLKVSIYPNTTIMKEAFRNSSYYFYTGLEKGSNAINGYVVVPNDTVSSTFKSKKTWTINLPDSEVIIAASKNKGKDPIASLGRVLGDRSVLYKYLNPNLIAFITQSAVSQPTESTAVTFYLVDVVSGAIHYRAIHPGGGSIQGKDSSIQIMISENFAVYTYWNHGVEKGKSFLSGPYANETIPNTKGMEIVVLELYEAEKPDKKSPGNHFSSFASFSPAVISGAFMFPFPVESIGITRTLSGITSKQILFGLSSGQVYGIGRKFLDPRRPDILTSNDKEEELLPYTPVLDYNPLNSVTRDHYISSKWIESLPMHLESSSLVIAGGLDIVSRIIHPSSNFDILSDDFNYFNLIGTILILVALTLAAKIAVDNKKLGAAWH